MDLSICGSERGYQSTEGVDLVTLFSHFAGSPLGSAGCRVLPAPHPVLSSPEAMYSMGIPWDGCSSKN